VLVVAVGLEGTLFVAATITALLVSVLAPQVLDAGRRSRDIGAQLEPSVWLLSRLDIFDGAERPALERLAMNIVVEQVDDGAVVVSEGDDADDFFVVESGTFVATTVGVEVNNLGAQDWFGEIGLLRRAPRTATVTSTSPSVVWRIPGDVFLAAVTSSSGLSDSFTETMESRLRASDAVHAQTGDV
jgi:CRP-like cAMP-binding protein